MSKVSTGYYLEENCDLRDFADQVLCEIDAAEVPNASDVPSNIPVYDMDDLRSRLIDPSDRRTIMAEWARVLRDGAGVVVLQRAYADTSAVDEATDVYNRIIAQEKAGHGSGADHFAAAGSNDRIWNSLQKLCLAAPEVYVRYFANPVIDAVCEAWLGPNYQMTAQVNVVHPGGSAQQAHRDYHLGFQTADICAAYPAHVHELSPMMTLQGGIAHGDTPLESGPTKLLPFSQRYQPGYAAWRRPDFRSFFEEHHVQLPLEKGDALFFNPALFHAAGSNSSTDIHRMVNLLQVSSAFGRAMETVDRNAMSLAIFEPLKDLIAQGALSQVDVNAVVAMTAEGYSFPTNLDSDPPEGGLAPQTQSALLKQVLSEGGSRRDFAKRLDAQNVKKLP